MKKAAGVLRDFGVEFSSFIISAHRAGELLAETVARVEKDGAEVIIAGAGLAAHLPGVIASMTVLPVIGVPLDGGKVGGLDALLSIVQMPKQIPVATVGLDNAANAAYLAVKFLPSSIRNSRQNFWTSGNNSRLTLPPKAERVWNCEILI